MYPSKFPLKEEFEAWLRQKEPSSTVGMAGDDHDCPLVRWLADAWSTRVVVGVESALIGPYPALNLPMPSWAREFVLLVDNDSEDEEVTAMQALAFLGTVVED